MSTFLLIKKAQEEETKQKLGSIKKAKAKAIKKPQKKLLQKENRINASDTSVIARPCFAPQFRSRPSTLLPPWHRHHLLSCLRRPSSLLSSPLFFPPFLVPSLPPLLVRQLLLRCPSWALLPPHLGW